MDAKLEGFTLGDKSDKYVYDGRIFSSQFPVSSFEAIRKMKCYHEDVLIASFPKTGTTWLSEITWLVMNDADTDAARTIHKEDRIPFLEIKFPNKKLPQVEEMSKVPPRVMKTHLNAEYFDKSISEGNPRVIIGIRDVKDTITSYFHHLSGLKDSSFTGSWDEYFAHFEKDKFPFGDFGEFYKSWWGYADKPNGLIVRYEDMLANPREVIIAIAEHCNKTLTKQQIDTIEEHTSFNKMKENPGLVSPNYKNFFRKGVVGDWQNHFTNEQLIFIQNYEDKLDFLLQSQKSE